MSQFTITIDCESQQFSVDGREDRISETEANTLCMNRIPNAPTQEDRVFRKLIESPFYATYQKAFEDATGMGLLLIPFEKDSPPPEPEFRNRFCTMLNQSRLICESCTRTCLDLHRLAESSAQTVSCFAKLRETAIPVRAAGRTFALLRTGQVSTSKLSEQGFESVADGLKKHGATAEQLMKLKEAWLDTRSLPVGQYEGIITLLSAFAIQFSNLLNRILIEDSHAEPDIVMKSKRFINAHLEEKFSLEDVSHHVGVSTFYFCKIFKSTTRMTFTEYVNRRRIERAKQKLMNPKNRVTEIAFDVGYQSLSHFNRSFLRYVGVSPTGYRERQAMQLFNQTLEAA